jgi:hypothetical protein
MPRGERQQHRGRPLDRLLAGAGDKIDISDLLVGWNGSASTLGNYLHVTNSNGNTVISIDRDGAGSTYTNTTLVTLDGVQTTYDELVNQQHIITT